MIETRRFCASQLPYYWWDSFMLNNVTVAFTKLKTIQKKVSRTMYNKLISSISTTSKHGILPLWQYSVVVRIKKLSNIIALPSQAPHSSRLQPPQPQHSRQLQLLQPTAASEGCAPSLRSLDEDCLSFPLSNPELLNLEGDRYGRMEYGRGGWYWGRDYGRILIFNPKLLNHEGDMFARTAAS